MPKPCRHPQFPAKRPFFIVLQARSRSIAARTPRPVAGCSAPLLLNLHHPAFESLAGVVHSCRAYNGKIGRFQSLGNVPHFRPRIFRNISNFKLLICNLLPTLRFGASVEPVAPPVLASAVSARAAGPSGAPGARFHSQPHGGLANPSAADSQGNGVAMHVVPHISNFLGKIPSREMPARPDVPSVLPILNFLFSNFQGGSS
jgi:hypothetical protein